ncbi:MAG TPA: radical SAM protein [Candidatus Brocadiia bacterium]|nr:radical SAM protein [Candidatus Brocadiia bacterium]
MLRVNEIYKSIQGESSYAGLLFGLVRLTGCNLRCRYCDTRFAWEEGEGMELPEIMERIESLDVGNVLVTGGEPLTQRETPKLLAQMIERDWTTLLETNGSLDIDLAPRGVIRIVDFKTPGSGCHEANDWRNVERLTPEDEVKFVIASREDYEWSCGKMRNYSLNDLCEVLFSAADGFLHHRDLAEWIIRDSLPVRMQVPLHRAIWPDRKRGT